MRTCMYTRASACVVSSRFAPPSSVCLQLTFARLSAYAYNVRGFSIVPCPQLSLSLLNILYYRNLFGASHCTAHISHTIITWYRPHHAHLFTSSRDEWLLWSWMAQKETLGPYYKVVWMWCVCVCARVFACHATAAIGHCWCPGTSVLICSNDKCTLILRLIMVREKRRGRKLLPRRMSRLCQM